MEYLDFLIDIILHIDVYLAELISIYKNWIYAILFLVIFCETGIVFAAFLPGDSLLFVTGTLAAIPANHVNVHLITFLLVVAAILGDTTNYWIGRRFGERMYNNPRSRIFKPEHLDDTRRFYEKYGGKTIVLARFLPIIRTFAPFVAGMGQMNYNRFLSFNVLGGIGWVVSLVYAGYFLGGISIVQENIKTSIIIIIILANLPALIEFIKNRIEKAKQKHRNH